MINRFKLGMKLVKYSFKYGQNVGYMGFYTLMGIIVYFLPYSRLLMPIYLTLASLWIPQMLGSLQYCAQVLSSPSNRKLCTSVIVAVSLPICLAFYALNFLFVYIDDKRGIGERYPSSVLIVYGAMVMAMMIYEVLWPRMSVVMAAVFLLVVYVPVFFYMISEDYVLDGISLGAAAGIGFAEILLGAVLQYLIARRAYRMSVKYEPMRQTIQRYR